MNDERRCPFCGCYLIKFEKVGVGGRMICANCDACGPVRQDREWAARGWNEVCEMHEAAKAGIDAYEDLRNATPKQLLEAAIWFYRETVEAPAAGERMILFLRLGWELAQPGGWMHIAPIWLRESQKIAALDQ